MRIRFIDISNLRDIEHARIDGINPTLCLFGMSGQGKSSIQFAIQLALFGWCRLTRAPYSYKLQDLIRDGAKEATILLGIDDAALGWVTIHYMIYRGKTPNEFAVSNEDGEIIMKTREEFWHKSGVKESYAQIACLPDVFLGSKELSDILAEFLGGDITSEAIQEKCGDHYPWLSDWTKRKLLPMKTPADLAAVGKRAFYTRTELKHEITDAEYALAEHKAANAPVDKDGNPLGTDEKGATTLDAVAKDIELYESRLSTGTTRRDALLVELGASNTAKPASEVAAEREALQAKLEQARETERAADTALTKADTNKLAADSALEMRRAEESAAVNAMAEARRGFEAAKRGLAALTGLDGACPTCRRKYTEKLRAELLGPLETAVANAEVAHTKAVATHEAQGTLLVEARQNVANAESVRVKADASLRAAISARESIETQLGSLPANATPGRTLAEIESDLASTDEKIGRAERILHDLRRLNERIGAESRLKALQDELVCLDWAVKSFKDGEITKSLIGNGLENFKSRCNAELEPFGFGLDVRVTGKGVDVLLKVPGKSFRPVALCSGGEQVFARAALALAFQDCGAPVLLDEINLLDHARRKDLIKRLRDTDRTGSVVLAGAWQQPNSDMNRIASQMAPCTVVWTEDGAVRVLDPGKAVAA